MIKKLFIFFVFFVTSYAVSVIGQQSKLVLVKSFPDPESEQKGNYLAHPYDLVFYRNTYIVTDAVECCLKVFSSDGKYIRTIGSKGKGPGELLDPFVLTIDETNGNIYCGDQGNNRISCFSVVGKYLKDIKTSLPVIDIVFNNGFIYTASYSEVNQSLFTMYDTKGNICKFFGKFFDSRINKLTYGKRLYQNVSLSFNKDSLYVFYTYLPIIQVYDKDGNLNRTIRVKIKKVRKIYKDNLKGVGTFKNYREMVRSWLAGASVANGKLYCYSPHLFGSLLILDKYGNLLEKLPFAKKKTKTELFMHRFIQRIGNDFVFIDILNSQVKIYRLVRK